MAPDVEQIEQAVQRARDTVSLVGRRRWFPVARFEDQGREFVVAIRARVHPTLRTLSPREAEILERIGRGESNKVISYELGLAWSTVRVLVHRAARKLGCNGRRELEAWARARSGAAGLP